MERRQPPPGLGIGEIDLAVRSGGDDVELWIEHIDAVHHPVEPRQGEGLVALVLPHPVIATGNLLIGAGDDEIRRVHGDEIGGELGCKVVLRIVLAPEEIGVEIFGLFQGVGDVALRHLELLSQQGGHQIAIGVVADDQIGAAIQLCHQLFPRLDGKSLQIRPHLEARDPVAHHLSSGRAERHPQNGGVLGTGDGLEALVAGGTARLGDQARHHQDPRCDVQPLLMDPSAHLLLQRPDLIQDVDHLPAGVGQAQDVGLTEKPMGRNDGQPEDHGDARKKLLQGDGIRGLQDVGQQLHGAADARHRPPPAGHETERLEGSGNRIPLGIGGLPRKILLRPAQGQPQPFHRADSLAQHQLLPLVLMDPQKTEQPPVTPLVGAEQPAGEMAIEEFHASPYGARLVKPGKLPVEGLQIHLQCPGALSSLHLALLEGEKLRHRDGFKGALLDMESQVVPARHLRTHRQIEPGGIHHRLLGCTDDVGQNASRDGGFVLAAERIQPVLQITVQQEWPAQAQKMAQQKIGVVPVVDQIPFQLFANHLSPSSGPVTPADRDSDLP